MSFAFYVSSVAAKTIPVARSCESTYKSDKVSSYTSDCFSGMTGRMNSFKGSQSRIFNGYSIYRLDQYLIRQ